MLKQLFRRIFDISEPSEEAPLLYAHKSNKLATYSVLNKPELRTTAKVPMQENALIPLTKDTTAIVLQYLEPAELAVLGQHPEGKKLLQQYKTNDELHAWMTMVSSQDTLERIRVHREKYSNDPDVLNKYEVCSGAGMLVGLFIMGAMSWLMYRGGGIENKTEDVIKAGESMGIFVGSVTTLCCIFCICASGIRCWKAQHSRLTPSVLAQEMGPGHSWLLNSTDGKTLRQVESELMELSRPKNDTVITISFFKPENRTSRSCDYPRGLTKILSEKQINTV